MLPLGGFTGYFDDTGEPSDPRQKFSGIAGLLAHSEKWPEFEQSWWPDALAKAGKKEYHGRKIGSRVSVKRVENIRDNLLDAVEKLTPIPISWTISLDALREIPTYERRGLRTPYYQAFLHCVGNCTNFVRNDMNVSEQGILTIFDNKLPFESKAQAYYKKGLSVFPLLSRHWSAPSFRSSRGFAPLQAADLIADILKNEYKRQLYEPHNERPLPSFERIHTFFSKAMYQPHNGYTSYPPNVPFLFLRNVEDIKTYIARS